MMARRPETRYPSEMLGNALAKTPETPPTPALVRRGGEGETSRDNTGLGGGWA